MTHPVIMSKEVIDILCYYSRKVSLSQSFYAYLSSDEYSSIQPYVNHFYEDTSGLRVFTLKYPAYRLVKMYNEMPSTRHSWRHCGNRDTDSTLSPLS